MRKTWLVARQTLLAVIGRWSYWVSMFSPLISGVLVIGMGALVVWATADQKQVTPSAPDLVKEVTVPFAQPVGYVDEAGLLRRLPADVPPGKFIAYATSTEARAALEAGAIVGYYVIPVDYLTDGRAAYYASTLTLFTGTDKAFKNMLMANLVVTDDAAQAWRAMQPVNITYQHAGDAPLTARGVYTLAQGALGFFVLGLFIAALLSIGPYWLNFMAAERERGMLELLLTSVSPGQFLGGKLLAALLLLGPEVLLPLACLGLMNEGWRNLQTNLASAGPLWQLIYQEVPPLSSEQLLLVGIALLSGLFVYSALFVIAGVLLPTIEATGAVNNVVAAGLSLLIFGLFGVLADPGGALALGLSLFPLTAPVFLPVRLLAGGVPFWQVGLSIGLMLTTVGLLLWLAVYLFQLRQWWNENLWLSIVRGGWRALTRRSQDAIKMPPSLEPIE